MPTLPPHLVHLSSFQLYDELWLFNGRARDLLNRGTLVKQAEKEEAQGDASPVMISKRSLVSHWNIYQKYLIYMSIIYIYLQMIIKGKEYNMYIF
jgi:hypothetical protein